jgi:alkyl hydroperoxide reductase subunit AhpC
MAIQLGHIAPDFEQDSTEGKISLHHHRLGNSRGVLLQLADARKVTTPLNWTNRTPVMIAPSLSNEDARQRFPGGWKELKPYLRVVEQPPLPR